MADTKTTGLTELTVAAAADLLYIVDDVAGTPISKKITLANLAANLGAIGGTGITLAGGTVTDSAPIVNGSQTWNDVTKTFVLDSMNVTDTASAAASLLWERKLNSQRKHQFTKTGLEIFNSWTSDSVYERSFMRWVANALEIGTEHVGATAREIKLKVGAVTALTIATNGASSFGTYVGTPFVFLNTASKMYGVAGGSITLYNAAETDFSRLQFGGTSSSFPALKRSAAQLHAKLADDSAFAQLAFLFPSSDPLVAGVWWDNAGTLTRSAG